MINDLIALVVYLIVAGLILWLAFWVIDQIPLPPPFHQVVRVILVVIACLIVIYALLGLIGAAPRLRVGGIECPSIETPILTWCAQLPSAAA